MGVVANLVVRVSASVKEFEKELAGLERSWGRTGQKLETIGGDLTKAITLPLAGIAVGAVKMSMDFESAMTKVRTLAGESQGNIGKLKQAIMDLAPAVGVGPTALADALLVVESTGFRGGQALDILKVSAQASAVGLGDTKDVARALTAAINAYGIENLSAADAADILFATVDAGGAEADELATELGRVVGLAAQMGVSFQEVGAFIATYTRLGLSASEATTGLSGVLNTLLSPTKEARDALATMGLSAQGLRNTVAEQGLTEALIMLQGKLQGNADATAAVFGNVRALAGVMGTAGAQATSYRQILEQISNSANILNDRFAIWKTTTAATWKEFTAQAQVAAIQLGEQLAPAFSRVLIAAAPLLESVVKLIQWFSELPQGVQTATIGFFALAAAVGPIAWTIGTILSTASSFIGLLRTIGVVGPVAGAGSTTAATGVSLLARALGVFAAPVAILAGLHAVGMGIAKVVEQLRGIPGSANDIPAYIRNSPVDPSAILRNPDPGRPGSLSGTNQAHGTFATPNINDPNAIWGGGIGSVIKEASGASVDAATAKVSKFTEAVVSLVDRIGGAEVINTATQWVEAIKRVGGIGKLTHAELTQFSDDIAAAVTKLKALGQEVPRTWEIIARTVKQNEALQKTRDMLGDSLGGFSGLNRQQLLVPGRAMSPDVVGGLMQGPADLRPQPSAIDIWRGATPTKEAGASEGNGLLDLGRTWGNAVHQGFAAGVGSLPQIILGALQGGGDVAKSIGAKFGGDLGSSIGSMLIGDGKSGIGKFLAGGMGGMLGKSLGGAIGSLIPGLGSMLGSLIGPLIGKLAGKIWHGIQGWFGTDEEARDVNPARDAFLAKFGGAGTGEGSGFNTLAARLTEMTGEEGGGSLFRALTQADTMAEFNAAVQAIEQQLASVHNENTQGFNDTTAAADGLNLALQGSDEAIAKLGETQVAVVDAMLQGFDGLMAKLQEFIDTLTLGRTILGEVQTGGAIGDGAGMGYLGGSPTFDESGGGAGIPLTDVPSFANEGVVSKPTLALIGDAPGGEPEYVLRKSTVDALQRDGGGGGGAAFSFGDIVVNAPGGDPLEVRKATALGVLDAIERGGAAWQKFRKLSVQVAT